MSAYGLTAPLVILFSSISLYLERESYLHDNAVITLILFSVSLIPACLSCVFKKYYQGIGHLFITNQLSAGDGLVMIAPFAWLFGIMLGGNGVWVGVIIGQTLNLLVMSIIIWRKSGKISFSAEAYSYLAPGFGAARENVVDLTVSDMGSAEEASEKIYDFYIEKNLSRKTAMLISLCTEEVARNILEYGFSSDKKKHTLEIRTVFMKDKCTLHFRDDCISFDPVKYVETHNEQSPEKHIGLRMVMKMVDEAKYINSLGLNNLMLSICVKEKSIMNL